jgi:hypothetical protein
MSGKTTEDLIADIYTDTGTDLVQLTELRSHIDHVADEVLEQEGSRGIIAATCKSFDVTRLLVEEGVMKTRHRGRDPVDQAGLRAIVAANIAYLNAAVGALPDQTPQ